MTRPLGPGSVSLGLSAVGDSATEVVDRLVADAEAAVAAGFDGVTLSEHHAGFPHYVPSPIALSGVLLARLPSGWACAAPAVLPLRTPVTVAEDLAWLAAAHPGRVGAGFVAGYQRSDFEAVGVDFDGRTATYWDGLATVTAAVGGGPGTSPVADDLAVRALQQEPIEVLAGVGGPLGARRAARRGAGLLVTSLRPPEEAATLVRTYREAGGTRTVVLIRRVHVGSDATGFGSSMQAWGSGAADAPWLAPDDSSLLTGDPEQVADALAAAVTASGATALNLRLDAHTADPTQVASQVAALGTEVLPRLRDALGWPVS